MKRQFTHTLLLLVFVAAFAAQSCKTKPDANTGATSEYDSNGMSYYHRTEETKLKPCQLYVEGEVKNPGKVDYVKYGKREVLFKQSKPNQSGEVEFVGAYRYRGYSLFDLLNPFIIEKKNAEEFIPNTDLYIIVENDKGDRVAFSWAEIFLGHQMHQVIIATEQASIEPYKKEVSYPKGSVWKVVASTDLYSYRELENPTKITIKSFDKKHYPIDRKPEDPYSPTVNLVFDNELKSTVGANVEQYPHLKYASIFYGMGMGDHGSPYFEGPMLRPMVEKFFEPDTQGWMRSGLAFVVGKDGFRNVFSVSELFNRVDQVEPILSIPPDRVKSGHFRLYHPAAFFADFSVRNLAEINFFHD